MDRVNATLREQMGGYLTTLADFQQPTLKKGKKVAFLARNRRDRAHRVDKAKFSGRFHGRATRFLYGFKGIEVIPTTHVVTAVEFMANLTDRKKLLTGWGKPLRI